jgi:plastocyanin
MRFIGVALVSSAVVLGACGGSDTSKQAAPAAAAPAAAPAATPAAAAATGTAAPITGKTIEVKMIGDATGSKFEPKDITLSAGDGIKFTVVSGGPHNVVFDKTGLAPDVAAQLDANLGADRMAEMTSNLKMNPGESITVSFGNIKPGKYQFNCTPHLAMNMKGSVTVK